MSTVITLDDFEKVSWSEYQEVALRLAEDIKSFCIRSKLRIESIIPIMRGGGVLAIHLSHLLGVWRLLPCQYKYTWKDNQYIPECIYTTDLSQLEFENKCFLVVEGNHASGTTAQLCIDSIFEFVKDAKILYCALSRDASFLNRLKGTIYETQGMLSNEARNLSEEYCKEHGIRYKLTVFPWESIEEEYREVLDSQGYLTLKNGKIPF